ncbi:MAG: aminoglycoside phosphotransferase family protein [Caldilineaceae bacterium]
MQAADIRRAVAAAKATAAALGLRAEDAVVLQDSNRIAVQLLPCDVLARVAYVERQASAEFEIEITRQLAATDSPVAALDPRIEPRAYVLDGFVITLWRYYEPVSPLEIAPAEYAQALAQLHVGLRQIDVPTPHFTDRIAQAQRLVDNPDDTPELPDADRALLSHTLQSMRRAISDRGGAEQLLHGEPHPGNLLQTKDGLRFIDWETCCRGPVEFDIVHAPEEIRAHYPGADQELLRQCHILMLAMIITWRWERDDQLPNGRQLGKEWLEQMRQALARGRCG